MRAQIRGTDVHIDGTTVRIAVPAPAPRNVVVRERFADRIVDLARAAGPGLLIGDPVGKNAISSALARVDVDQGRVKVESRRLRATWIAALLAARVDLRVVITLAGNVSASTVFAIAATLPPVDPDEAARQVRVS